MLICHFTYIYSGDVVCFLLGNNRVLKYFRSFFFYLKVFIFSVTHKVTVA
jgi:hypothetical protein